MHIRLALLALLLGGCDDDVRGTQNDAAVDMTATDAAMCVKTCSACGADEACVGTPALARYQAACLKKCTVTSDCGAGARCVAIFNEVGVPAVCVSDAAPGRCPGVAPPAATDHCDFPPASCLDANTLDQTFQLNMNHVCGHERVACPNGCVNGDTDAGVLAHCQ